MRALLLDTTFLIDAERAEAALEGLLLDDDDIAIAAVSAAELLVGVELARGRHRARRRTYGDDLLATVSVLPYDLQVAAAHAQLLAWVRRTGTPRGAHDLMIAATAGAHRRTIVTADATAFSGLPDIATIGHDRS